MRLWKNKPKNKKNKNEVDESFKHEGLTLYISNVVPTIKSIGHWSHDQSESPHSCKLGNKMVPWWHCAIYRRALRVNDATSSQAKCDPHPKRLEGYQQPAKPPPTQRHKVNPGIRCCLCANCVTLISLYGSSSYANNNKKRAYFFHRATECALIYPHVFYPASGFLPDGT